MTWEPQGNIKGPPGAGTIIRDATPLIIGQDFITVVFDLVMPNDDWRIEEMYILNTADATPLNLLLGTLTAKARTGFTVQLVGLPDTGNYFLRWAINAQSLALVPATTYIFTGPTEGISGVESTPFTVRLPHGTTIVDPVTITPVRFGGTGTGTFTPPTVTLSAVSPTASFTFTPASVGDKTISVSNDGGLIDPAALHYNSTSLTHFLDSLVSHWKLDEASGTRNDSHGTNHLAQFGGVLGAAGKINNGALFVAANSQYLSVASNPSLQVTGEFTFALWLRVDDASILSVFIAKDDGTTREYLIGHSNTGGLFFSVNAMTAQVGTPAVVGTLYHVICWVDAGDAKCRLRVNDATTYVSVAGSLLAPAATDFSMGARIVSGVPQLFASGLADEVDFWKRKLTPLEMTAHFNGGTGLPYSSYTP